MSRNLSIALTSWVVGLAGAAGAFTLRRPQLASSGLQEPFPKPKRRKFKPSLPRNHKGR